MCVNKLYAWAAYILLQKVATLFKAPQKSHSWIQRVCRSAAVHYLHCLTVCAWERQNASGALFTVWSDRDWVLIVVGSISRHCKLCSAARAEAIHRSFCPGRAPCACFIAVKHPQKSRIPLIRRLNCPRRRVELLPLRAGQIFTRYIPALRIWYRCAHARNASWMLKFILSVL